LQTREPTEVVPDAAPGARVADGDARDVAETQHQPQTATRHVSHN